MIYACLKNSLNNDKLHLTFVAEILEIEGKPTVRTELIKAVFGPKPISGLEALALLQDPPVRRLVEEQLAPQIVAGLQRETEVTIH